MSVTVNFYHPSGVSGKAYHLQALKPYKFWNVHSGKGLSNFTFTFHFYALEKEMATHPSVLAWRIPGTGEPGGLPSMGLHRVGDG